MYTSVYLPGTVCAHISVPLQTVYQTKKKGRAVLERKKKLPVSVCVLYVYTVVSMHAGVYPARPVMSALSGDSLINV